MVMKDYYKVLVDIVKPFVSQRLLFLPEHGGNEKISKKVCRS